MESYKKLLLGNHAWVADKLAVQPDYFLRHVADQKPEFLWIGCSDSRVPAEDITGAEPGELFVHRNVANLVVHTDFNFLSVLQYAVDALGVRHVVVCGHYNCGGVKNAMARKDLGLLNSWLRNIKDIYQMHENELKCIEEEQARWDRLVELNVIEQVRNIAKTSVIQKAWADGHPTIHGWVYDLKTGYLKELAKLKPDAELEQVYMFERATPAGAH
ncbi:MAG: carbonic anhydrase [Bryobacteraceae bacterium]